MTTKTVGLDGATEKKLLQVRKRTGLSTSAILKKGVEVVYDELDSRPTFWEVYEKLDLGEGGYAVAPAAEAKAAVRSAIRRKHRR